MTSGTNRNKELLKNTCILSMGQLIPRLMSLVALPVLTKYLDVSEYGIYDLLFSISGLLLPLLTLQIQQALFRFLLGCKKQEEYRLYITSASLFLLFMNFLLLVLSFCFRQRGNAYVVIIYLVGISLESFYLLLGQMARGIGKNLQYSFAAIIYSFINLGGIFVFVVKAGWGIKGILYGILIGYFLAGLFLGCILPLKKYLNPLNFSRSHLKRLLCFSLPIVPSSLSLWIVNLSDRLIISSFLGTGMNGIYGIAYKIPQLYVIAFDIFNLAWTETASKVYEDGVDNSYYSTLFKQLFQFLTGAMMCLLAVFPVIFKVLINEQYAEAYNQIPILFMGVFFSSLVSFYGGIYVALNKTKYVGISSLMGAIINIGVNILMIQRFGLYAASVSSAVSFFIILCYRAWDIGKRIEILYDKREMMLGLLLLILESILVYQKKLWVYGFCCILALFYNWCKNRYLLKGLVNLFWEKMKRGK